MPESSNLGKPDATPYFATVDEVAAVLRVTPDTVRQMAREGRIPARKVGKSWRFDPVRVKSWISGNIAEPQPAGCHATEVSELALPFLPPAATEPNGFAFKDPAFSENRTEPVHRWVPWIAGFSSGFVRDCLREYLADANPAGALVLDPFAGVGTTLLEAFRCGYNTVGFEVNPYAALAARAKLEAAEVPVSMLEVWTRVFKEFMRETADRVPDESAAPQGFRSRIPFFSPGIRDRALWTLKFIECTGDPKLKDLLLLAFGSVMVKFSNYTYEPSLASRPGSGKPLIEQADVAGIIAAKLREMADDCRSIQRGFDQERLGRRHEVIHDSIFRGCDHLEEGSVDLAITSPPYLNNYHYVRNTRPHLFWLGLVERTSDLHQVEHASFGKFWQTVRDAGRLDLQVNVPALEAIISRLRQTNTDKGVYGGNGWANYAAQYFNDTNRFCGVMARLMKPGGRMVVVIGNSIIQGIEMKVDAFLAEIASAHGFETEAIHELRRKRVGNSIIRSSVRSAEDTGARLYEVAVVLRRRSSGSAQHA